MALFAVLFEYLPDVKVRWRDAWIGAAVTSVLHAVGKLAIGLYIEKAGVGSAYGAAGALVVLISWLYWSSLIVLFGVEVTRAVAVARGLRVVPEPYARRTAVTYPGADPG